MAQTMAIIWRICGEKTAETWRVSPSFLCENQFIESGGRRVTSSRKTPAGFSSQKGRDDMDAVNRLIQAGIRPDCATETVLMYEARGDAAGLEHYVQDAETRAAREKGAGACLVV